MGKQWKQWLTLFFWAPKITADGDCSHKIKRLIPWKESYDQPRQHIKKQNIILPIKVHLVKAMVFPVVMIGCKSWNIKKAEHQSMMLLNCGVGEDSSESFGQQGEPSRPS